MLLIECNVAEPRERCSGWECGVRRESLGFGLLYLCDDLLQVRDKAARGVVPYDRKVRGERLKFLLLCGSAEDGLQGNFRFFINIRRRPSHILSVAGCGRVLGIGE